jgi:phenylacetate-CoA ligase
MTDHPPDPRARHRAAFIERLPAEVAKVTWPLERLLELRDTRLRALIRHAREHSPWHRERLADVDVDGLTGEHMGALPTMTKADLMDNWDAISCDPELTLSAAVEHLHGEARHGPGYLLGNYQVVNTGGSSGHRAVVAWDFDGLLETALSRFRYLTWVLAQDPPEGPVKHARVMPTGAVHISGVLDYVFAIPGVEARTFSPSVPLSEMVSGLAAMQPTALTGYPSLLHYLAAEQLGGRLRIAPHFVTVSGEPLTPEGRSVMELAWGRPVIDVWGATESGELAISNPLAPDGSPAMHRLEDASVAELVDDLGRPVPLGVQAADLLVTNVLNRSLPIIRYRLGDSPTMLADNPGPWTGRRIAPIEGREYQPFVYPNGDVVQLHAIGLVLREEARVLEYQVRQTADGIDIDVLLERPIDLATLRAGVLASVERAGLHSPRVTIRAAPSIPRNPLTGKIQMYVPLAAGA